MPIKDTRESSLEIPAQDPAPLIQETALRAMPSAEAVLDTKQALVLQLPARTHGAAAPVVPPAEMEDHEEALQMPLPGDTAVVAVAEQPGLVSVADVTEI